MGQKVGGYRRNVPFGKETNLVSQGWAFDVNPNGRVGWNGGTSGRKEGEYGGNVNDARRLRKELEEVRKRYGCELNGLGRKGTKERGYTVYGEYRVGQENPKNRKTSKSSKKINKNRKDREVAMERVVRNYERKINTKVERKRTNLKSRRKDTEGRANEKEERKSVLGHSAKRGKVEERCETIARSGVVPVTERRAKLMVQEREGSLNHMEILRNMETLRTHHGRSSQKGRKRLGEVDQKGKAMKGGYYGYNVVVKGPLEGSRRTLVYNIQMGTVPRGTKRARIMTSHEHAKTTYGTLGVQVTYCYGRG